MSGCRVGTGFDAHRLVLGRPLWLGGIEIPFGSGLLGHSDGDCLTHAICDAVLGAAAAGDMGLHFPSGDARFRGATGVSFLREAARIVRDRGYEVLNLDATVIAEAPPLASHLEAMRRSISGAIGMPFEDVSVKAKSTDGLGALGRGDGIAAHAVALLRARTPGEGSASSRS